MATVAEVDLARFMGDWYVIASIPTRIERQAYNAVESYELDEDGTTVHTTFTFRQGGFDGPQKRYTLTGFVRDDPSKAVWGMQFIWPIKAEYLVVSLDESYETTIIGRSKRDYVWIMARSPELDEQRYQELVDEVSALGYDASQLRRVPQRW